jgi:hypothetical protein
MLRLYTKMKDQPYEVHLAAMWNDPGIERPGNTVRFIDLAPSASIGEDIADGEHQRCPIRRMTVLKVDQSASWSLQSSTLCSMRHGHVQQHGILRLAVQIAPLNSP